MILLSLIWIICGFINVFVLYRLFNIDIYLIDLLMCFLTGIVGIIILTLLILFHKLENIIVFKKKT